MIHLVNYNMSGNAGGGL